MRIETIYRYPVKGLSPERLDGADLAAGETLFNDRAYAIEQALERDNISGTPSYMAPEQARTDGPALTPATDVWALGAVLYETLTGHPPFDGVDAADTVRLLLDANLRKPSRYLPLPADLEAICLHCLEKDPAARYDSAAALGAALGPSSDHHQITAWSTRSAHMSGIV